MFSLIFQRQYEVCNFFNLNKMCIHIIHNVNSSNIMVARGGGGVYSLMCLASCVYLFDVYNMCISKVHKYSSESSSSLVG